MSTHPSRVSDTQTLSAFKVVASLSESPHVCVICFVCFASQIGGLEHAAEIHWVHVKEGTEAELLVVGVMFDNTVYGSNVEVRKQLSWENVVL